MPMQGIQVQPLVQEDPHATKGQLSPSTTTTEAYVLRAHAPQQDITAMKSLFSSVQSLSHIQLCATSWTATCQASLFITNSQRLLKLMPIDSVMPSNHLILCFPSPPVFNLSLHQGLFQ